MPTTEVIFYKDTNGNAPVVLWLEELREGAVARKAAFEKNPKAHTYDETQEDN